MTPKPLPKKKRIMVENIPGDGLVFGGQEISIHYEVGKIVVTWVSQGVKRTVEVFPPKP